MRMMDKFDIAGYLELQPDTTHVVSMWKIPGGYDYSNAYIFYTFYDREEEAKAFCERWDASPEMPVLLTLEEYLKIQEKTRQHKQKLALRRLEDNL